MKINFVSEKRLVFFAPGPAEGPSTPPPPPEGPKAQPETAPSTPKAANDAAQDMTKALGAPRPYTEARWPNTDVSTKGPVPYKAVVMQIMKAVDDGRLANGGPVKVPVVTGDKREIVTYNVTITKNGNIRNVLISETDRVEDKPVIQARETVVASARPAIAPQQKAAPKAAAKPAPVRNLGTLPPTVITATGNAPEPNKSE